MLKVYPITVQRWQDLEKLFGDRGACGGCWCMWFRLPRREFEAGRGESNRRSLRALAESDHPPGLLGYADDTPVAWCSVAPRAEFRRLRAARTLRPIDNEAVWTIMCLFVARSHRHHGYSIAMIRAACAFAQRSGARIVEAYPIQPSSPDVPPIFASQGTLSAFLSAGFTTVAEPSRSRAIVRWYAHARAECVG